MADEFELLEWDEEIIEVLKELPRELQWEPFLQVIKLLDRLGTISIPYLHNRFNIDIKVTDRILTSLVQLGWGYFSKNYIYISDQAKKDFEKLKTMEVEDDDS